MGAVKNFYHDEICGFCTECGQPHDDDGPCAASVGRNAKRQDPQGLGPKDEHAVTAKQADAHNNRGEPGS